MFSLIRVKLLLDLSTVMYDASREPCLVIMEVNASENGPHESTDSYKFIMEALM